jgi:hypothetical protein
MRRGASRPEGGSRNPDNEIKHNETSTSVPWLADLFSWASLSLLLFHRVASHLEIGNSRMHTVLRQRQWDPEMWRIF